MPATKIKKKDVNSLSYGVLKKKEEKKHNYHR